jgi:hypothetical protein
MSLFDGKPTGREVQAMHRLQTLTDRYIAEGLTPADARTRATEELRANPRGDERGGSVNAAARQFRSC